MLEYGLRFLAGGIAVSTFAALGDSLRPKSFAGLFGAAPSIALATLLITLRKRALRSWPWNVLSVVIRPRPVLSVVHRGMSTATSMCSSR